jgi:phosphoglycolate phosphatase
MRLAVLTNKPIASTRRMLDALDLSRYFTRVIGGDEACGRKPDPTGLQSLLTEAGMTADAALMIGDSHVDLETARRAGTPMCLARYGFGFREGLLARLGPGDLSVASPAELMERLTAAS